MIGFARVRLDGRDKRSHDVGEALDESGRRLAPSTNGYRYKSQRSVFG
jgi:hypothetical protein